MARKKSTNNEQAKSTVINMRDEFDWGKILFNACYVFNNSLAEAWLKYVDNYNHDTAVKEVQDEMKNALSTRDYLLSKKSELNSNKKDCTQQVQNFYKKYIKTLLIGDFIKERRLNNNSVDFDEIMHQRKDAQNQYYKHVDESIKAIREENSFTQAHLFQARSLGTRARTLKKIVNMHELELAHPIHEDKEIIYNLLTSEEQAERLMGVCINILNTYSEKEFSTILNIYDREKIADGIYEYFSKYEHNYDFITGCYYVGEDNKLHLKDIKTLKEKLYNGYYFTIRGFVQRSYIAARDEKYNIESVDINWNEEDNNSNKGYDKYINTEEKENQGGYSIFATSSQINEFGDGMIKFWHSCQEYLIQHVDTMANELYNNMKSKFPNMNYYNSMTDNQVMINWIIRTLDGIDEELKRGRNVNSKLKHIVLDSMEGAETQKEWKMCVDFMSNIILKYIHQFFIHNRNELQMEEI